MKRATLAATIIIALLAGVSEGRASTITVGTVGLDGNAFPFGGTFGSNPGTEYQQVYNAALFGALPIVITDITFFRSGETGTFDDGTYTFELSSTAKAVNGLDTTTLGNNVGPDQAFFALPLSGAVRANLRSLESPFCTTLWPAICSCRSRTRHPRPLLARFLLP